MLSLRQAAEATATTKSTILRAIQRGRLSASRSDDGGWLIDPAELFRVYKPRNVPAQADNVVAGQGAPPATTAIPAILEAQIESLREMLRRADREAEDLRADRDKWRDQATRLLSDQRPWWRRMTG